ncbi:MAG: hypothetical protein C4334_01895 [Pyrinomonas sp.]
MRRSSFGIFQGVGTSTAILTRRGAILKRAENPPRPLRYKGQSGKNLALGSEFEPSRPARGASVLQQMVSES